MDPTNTPTNMETLKGGVQVNVLSRDTGREETVTIRQLGIGEYERYLAIQDDELAVSIAFRHSAFTVRRVAVAPDEVVAGSPLPFGIQLSPHKTTP